MSSGKHFAGTRNAKSGTSLLEVLVALVVMAFLAIISASTLAFSARSLARAGSGQATADMALSRAELRTWIERAVTIAGQDGTSMSLAGDAHQLSLFAILDDGRFWPAAVTSIELVSAKTAHDAVEATAKGKSEQDQQPAIRTLALSGIGAQLKIGYFGKTSGAQDADWHDEWVAADGLPLLVRVSISDSETSYPPLIIRPGKEFAQREMSLSSLLPPDAPSRP